MVPSRGFALVLLLGLVTACASPPEVKQALRAKDQAYLENAQLMDQYRELLENVNTRFEYWQRLIETRLKLSLALRWATTDPGANNPPEKQQLLADTVAQQLGPDVMKSVNKVRLAKLPARTGTGNQELFKKGDGTMTTLIQALPGLAAAIDEAVRADYHHTVTPTDFSAYDDYRTNVAALRRMNNAVQNYLDIDVTASNQDVAQLADALRALRR